MQRIWNYAFRIIQKEFDQFFINKFASCIIILRHKMNYYTLAL